ncbi:MAG: hypothetical protein QOE77_190 [Blastocatellia bacterium]|nr:hypothetical protein [Blastocatellia bacterium]
METKEPANAGFTSAVLVATQLMYPVTVEINGDCYDESRRRLNRSLCYVNRVAELVVFNLRPTSGSGNTEEPAVAPNAVRPNCGIS